MSHNPFFTIITVCYNSSKTIKATIESVLNQSCQDYEYIIVDGKSTDNTLEIVDEYKKAFGSKLRIISEPDKGIYDAMNKGIGMAHGKLIGMINSDDWYELDALEIMKDSYDDGIYEILYGIQRVILNAKEELCWIKHHQFLEKNMITYPTCFITKDLYNEFGNYDLQYKSSADYDFMLRMYYNKRIKFKPVYKIIANFSLGGISGTNIGAIETAKIKKKYSIISNMEYLRIVCINKIKIFIKNTFVYKLIKGKSSK